MMRCIKCGVEQQAAMFCRQCGANQNGNDLHTQQIVQDEGDAETLSKGRFSFDTHRAKPVVPLVESPSVPQAYPPCSIGVEGRGRTNPKRWDQNLYCIIQFSYSATWLVEDVDINNINSIEDEAFKKKVERWARTPKNYDFSSVPLSKISFALEKGCEQLFHGKVNVSVSAPPKNAPPKNDKDMSWRAVLASWLSPSKRKDNEDADYINREAKTINNVEVRFIMKYESYGISTSDSTATFRIDTILETITDIYEETEQLIQNLTGLMNSLYDWSEFSAHLRINYSFPFDRNFIELLKGLLNRDDADGGMHMKFVFDFPISKQIKSFPP